MYINADTTKNFFDINQDLMIISEFDALIKKVGKKRSSTIMWSIYLAYHPSSGVYRKFSNTEDREKEVNKNYNHHEAFVDFREYDKIIDIFKKVCISKAVEYLSNWEKQLKEFDDYIESLTFQKGAKEKIESLKQRKELWDMFIVSKKDYDTELSSFKAAFRGTYQGSVLETGELFD